MGKLGTVNRLHTVSNWLHRKQVPLLPNVIYYFMRLAFATSVRPSVELGRGSQFSHCGLGIVLDDNVVIGEDCAIGHHVTIGGTDGHPGAPVLGRNVVLGVGAKILGPVKVGDYAIIGPNSVVLEDLPAHAVALGNPARIVNYTTTTELPAKAPARVNTNPPVGSRSPLEIAFIAALGLPSEANVTDLGLGTTANWDSVAHIQLVGAIEDAFGVVLDGDDIVAMTSYAATRDLLKEKYGIADHQAGAAMSESDTVNAYGS